MIRFNINLEPLEEADVENVEIRKFLGKCEANAKVWKAAMLAFLISLAASYLLGTFIGKDVEGGFVYTRFGTFLSIVIMLFFLAFVVTLIRDYRLKRKKWKCPHCGKRLTYFMTKQGGGLNFRDEDIMIQCCDKGYRMGKWKTLPLAIPEKCPACHTRFLMK